MADAAMSTMTEQEGLDALAEACARNCPVEVVRRGRNTMEPPGRGRMIDLRDDSVTLEEVHVIGRDVRYGVGDQVDCFFSHSNALLHFRATVLAAGLPVRLNERMIVPGMRVSRPEIVSSGQRRNVYRVSLGARQDAPEAKLWFARTIEKAFDEAAEAARKAAEEAGEEVVEPSQQQRAREKMIAVTDLLRTTQKDFDCRIADASDTGLGLTIYGGSYTRFKMFEHLWIRMSIPGVREPIVLLGEVRQSRAIPNLGARLGILLLRDDTGAKFATKIRQLTMYLTEVQRSSRR